MSLVEKPNVSLARLAQQFAKRKYRNCLSECNSSYTHIFQITETSHLHSLSPKNLHIFAFVLSLCIFDFVASIIHRPSKFLDPFSLFIILILGLKMLTVALDFYGFYVLLRLV